MAEGGEVRLVVAAVQGQLNIEAISFGQNGEQLFQLLIRVRLDMDGVEVLETE